MWPRMCVAAPTDQGFSDFAILERFEVGFKELSSCEQTNEQIKIRRSIGCVSRLRERKKKREKPRVAQAVAVVHGESRRHKRGIKS